MRRSYAAGATAIVVAVLGFAYLSQSPSRSGQPPPRGGATGEVIVFAADGWLWSYRQQSRRRILRMDAPSHRLPAFGRYVAVDGSGRLVVLSPRAGRPIAVVDLERRRVVARGQLPRGLVGRAIVVGPRTRRIYVVARRGHARRTRFGGTRSDAVLVILEADLKRRITSGVIRASAGHDWAPFAAGISSNERWLAVSYHGDDTTGLDFVDTKRSPRATCPKAMDPDHACIPAVHGDVEFVRDNFAATSGSERLLAITLRGAVRQWNTRLVDSHVTALVVDLSADAVYSVAQCGYAGGLSRVKLSSGTATLLAAPRQSRVCGAQIALIAGGDTLVTAGSSGAAAGRTSRLQWINTTTGSIKAQRDVTPAILALAPVPGD